MRRRAGLESGGAIFSGERAGNRRNAGTDFRRKLIIAKHLFFKGLFALDGGVSENYALSQER